MAVRRPRPPRKPRAVRTPGTQVTTVGAVGGGELGQAAEEIANGARALASWSTQIPGNIRVEVAGDTALIISDAPAAYPAETRARHPLFAKLSEKPYGKGWKHWYDAPGQRFLGPAADLRAGAAMARYATKIDRLCREAFK